MHRLRALAILLAAFLYLVLPTDLIPDFWILVGQLDDFLVLGLAVWWAWRELRGPRTRPAPEPPGSPSPYEVLGLRPGAGPEEIRRAYRERMAEYHPDKVAHLGPELQRLAHQKTLDIRRAYEELMHPGNGP